MSATIASFARAPRGRRGPSASPEAPAEVRARPEEGSGWRAQLDLRYARRGAATLLTGRAHHGPLRVQKPLYPEGPGICHTIVLHPPGGIAGGDSLALSIDAGFDTRALLTTPGAGKWYRSAGPLATQTISIAAAGGALVEWLPQPTIFFSGANAKLDFDVALAGNATFVGWDILCFGRTASGETFDRGALGLATRIAREGRPLLVERAWIDGAAAASPLATPAGLDRAPVVATMFICAPVINPEWIAAARAIIALEGLVAGVTARGGLLIARAVGADAEAARAWFVAIWSALRPQVCGRPAVLPRIWNT